MVIIKAQGLNILPTLGQAELKDWCKRVLWTFFMEEHVEESHTDYYTRCQSPRTSDKAAMNSVLPSPHAGWSLWQARLSITTFNLYNPLKGPQFNQSSEKVPVAKRNCLPKICN